MSKLLKYTDEPGLLGIIRNIMNIVYAKLNAGEKVIITLVEEVPPA